MRVLHFDIIGGIAGDMTVAALTSLGAPIQPLHEALQAMGLGQVLVAVKPVEVNGIGALRLTVEFPPEHVHRTLADLLCCCRRPSSKRRFIREPRLSFGD